MSEAFAKRSLNQIQPLQTKRQDTEASKKVTKPGRKPINSEPKNKRTAQNRAAQRAFRERKEKKMKELEDKVTELENEKKAATTEAEFLRIQVEMLSGELTKYKGSNFDINSLTSNKIKFAKLNNRVESSSSSSSSTPLSSAAAVDSKQTFDFPWSNLKMNSQDAKNSMSYSESSNSYKGENSLSPGSDFASSDTNSEKKKDDVQIDYDKNFDEKVFCNTLNLACGSKDKPVPEFPTKPSSDVLENNLNDSRSNLQTQEPTPSSISTSYDFNQFNKNNLSNNDFLSFLNNNNTNYDSSLAFNFSDSNKLLDDLDFLKSQNVGGYREVDDNDMGLMDDLTNSNSETNVKFDAFDPLTGLTNDELAFDPFDINLQNAINNNGGNAAPSFSPAEDSSKSMGNSSMGKYINSDLSSTDANNNINNSSTKPTPKYQYLDEDDDEDDNAVVPSKEQHMVKCSEIWDRVTSHPKYSELDIDGLCNELRAKAKCSDKGALLNKEDFEKILQKN